jgi:hypothetical protein
MVYRIESHARRRCPMSTYKVLSRLGIALIVVCALLFNRLSSTVLAQDCGLELSPPTLSLVVNEDGGVTIGQITYRNTCSTIALRNITARLSGNIQSWSRLDWGLEALAPGESGLLSIEVRVPRGTPAGSYKGSITFSGKAGNRSVSSTDKLDLLSIIIIERGKAGNRSVSSTAQIIVDVPPRPALRLRPIVNGRQTQYSMVRLSQEFTLEAEIINDGNVPIRNISVTLEGLPSNWSVRGALTQSTRPLDRYGSRVKVNWRITPNTLERVQLTVRVDSDAGPVSKSISVRVTR